MSRSDKGPTKRELLREAKRVFGGTARIREYTEKLAADTPELSRWAEVSIEHDGLPDAVVRRALMAALRALPDAGK